ncbi:hypothetical protein BCR33DRAFT_719708 [Rhizoclosmatium globosum]|uniref:CID domain-containing protein n=1 Tax=Rhizoclosmatium globosum TaxID=329046 RepID=A0A1Y2BZ07_9FUNG|nr:hypothetical protein BCR33DRAFT_719708 [Rhizoclosmatium globosum]|eukprot:ORY39877.1 hypothetical protein BCR33DRAFT_719708 [Rhizoclosmatium globosum]
MIETPTLNRLPLLYILDSICQQCNRARRQKDWIYLVSRDLDDILQEIIPDTEPINASAAKKCIKAWRSKSVFTAEVLDPVESRVDVLVAKAPAITERPAFSTKEIMRKIEEERDRHKRQREEGWYRPDPSMEDLGARKRGPSATPGGNKSVGVKGDEFSEMWEKIPIPENREWEILSEDLRRFDAEHGVHL